MKSNDLENYYVKGRTSGSKWNFDLQPLITDFNFYDFCCSANSSDHGGFLVITDKQYVVDYTNYENDRVTHHYANSLDGLRDYLSKHIVDKKSHDNHEIILNQERTK